MENCICMRVSDQTKSKKWVVGLTFNSTEPQEKKPDDGGHQGGNEEPKKEGMSGIRIFFTMWV